MTVDELQGVRHSSELTLVQRVRIAFLRKTQSKHVCVFCREPLNIEKAYELDSVGLFCKEEHAEEWVSRHIW